MLEFIISGDDAGIDELTTEVVCFAKPKNFEGATSAEIDFDKNFETICLSLSEQLNIQPKTLTVLEFYNAFAFLQEKARRARNGQKRP